MKIGFYNFYRQHNRNRMFETADCGIGDDLGYPFVHLAQRFREKGWELATIDTEPLENFDAVVFLDHPTILNPRFRRLARTRRVPIHLVIFESPAVRPDNWIRRFHAPFTKVFTWHPAWVDGQKYVRMHMPHKLPDFTPYAPSQADKFCCLIASQKYSWAREELSTERVRAIRWFERHHADAIVDKRLFRDYDELYRYLKGMSAAEYEGYRKAIHDFVHGEAIRPLGADAFVDMIVREVVTPLLAKG